MGRGADLQTQSVFQWILHEISDHIPQIPPWCHIAEDFPSQQSMLKAIRRRSPFQQAISKHQSTSAYAPDGHHVPSCTLQAARVSLQKQVMDLHYSVDTLVIDPGYPFASESDSVLL